MVVSKGWNTYMAHGYRHSNPNRLNIAFMVTPYEEKMYVPFCALFDCHGLEFDSRTKKQGK